MSAEPADPVGLGAARSATDLVAGDPAALAADADTLDRLAAGHEDHAARLRAIPPAAWRGEAAGQFAAIIAGPRRSVEAIAHAYRQTSAVLRAHAELLTWARSVTEELLQVWRDAGGTADPDARRRQATIAVVGVQQQVRQSEQQLVDALAHLTSMVEVRA